MANYVARIIAMQIMQRVCRRRRIIISIVFPEFFPRTCITLCAVAEFALSLRISLPFVIKVTRRGLSISHLPRVLTQKRRLKGRKWQLADRECGKVTQKAENFGWNRVKTQQKAPGVWIFFHADLLTCAKCRAEWLACVVWRWISFCMHERIANGNTRCYF